MRRVARLLLLAAAALGTAVAPALADRETAEFFGGRGDEALKGRRYAEAESHYLRALEEDPTHLVARYGLAQALLGRDAREDAVLELRRFLAEAQNLEPRPREIDALLPRVERQLEGLDASGTELRRLVDDHVEALLGFARRWVRKDEEVAVRALREVLVLRPGHPRATVLIESVGRSPKGDPVPLWNGRDLDGFTDMVSPRWQSLEQGIVADGRDASFMGRTERWFDGDFDVRMEARLVESFVGPDYFALCAPYDGKDRYHALGLFKGRLHFDEQLTEDENRKIWSGSPTSVEGWAKGGWNRYEMRFRGGTVVALVNGHEIASGERPQDVKGGFVGLLVQNCRVEIRDLELVPR